MNRRYRKLHDERKKRLQRKANRRYYRRHMLSHKLKFGHRFKRISKTEKICQVCGNYKLKIKEQR